MNPRPFHFNVLQNSLQIKKEKKKKKKKVEDIFRNRKTLSVNPQTSFKELLEDISVEKVRKARKRDPAWLNSGFTSSSSCNLFLPRY